MSEVKIRNAADPAKVKEAEKESDSIRKQEIADVFKVVSTEEGRRFYHRLLGICGVYKEVAEQSGSCTYYNAGKRSVGLRLQEDLVRASPDVYSKIVKEAYKTEIDF